MQQGGSGGRGGGGHQSQYEEIGGDPTDATSSGHMMSEPSEQLEEASPISYRHPGIGNSEELVRLGSGSGDDGGVGGGGNRWHRQETVALLKIRSDMDTVFRDGSIKGPLWEDVSRKLEELGYKRSAKKCKEKFENVQKYYKRTKDGRTGRQDGKTYKFFTQLEALHHITSVSTSLDVAPISVRITPTTTAAAPPVSAPTPAPPITTTSTATPFGINFSSNSSSSSQGYELGDEPSNVAGSSCKRKRSSSSSSKRMMGFFEGLMKQVMQKQEALQQVFLEAIEKREQDRMTREEGWKRQEMTILAREHQHIAKERALASSRDAAIVSFLQKLTGQTMQLSTTNTIPPVPPPPIQTAVTVVPPPFTIPMADPPLHKKPSIPEQQQPQPKLSHLQKQQQPQPQPKQSHLQQQQQQPQQKQSHLQQQQQQPPPPKRQNNEVVKYNQQPIAASEAIIAIPEQKVAPQEIGGSESNGPASSRWPKAEVLALINIRSGFETRYQEAGPKGPLWEEISTAMNKMGYKRNPKRCKEKWENINKYYKKVKESNKKRPDDAKTCPYFHQLDALYRKKILGAGGSSSFSDQNKLEGEAPEPPQHHDPPSDAPPITQQLPTHDRSENKTGADVDVDVFGEGNGKCTR